jgi:tetratricopeptide (TPR) repeat protein
VSALNTVAMARLTLQPRAPEAVLPLLERALRLMESSGGPENSDTAVLVNNIGTTLGRSGRLPEAEKHMSDALVRVERKLGPDHPTLVIVLFGLASVQQEQGRRAEALVHLQRAAAIQGALSEDIRGLWGPSLLELGKAYLDVDRARQAVAPLSQLVEGRPNFRIPRFLQAVARFYLADALWRSGGDTQRALQLAEEVRGLVNPQAPAAAKLLKDVDAWLAKHRK